MKYVFWSAAAVIAYAYAGYALWLWVRSRIGSRPVQRAEYLPPVSLVMVVRNEEAVLERKLRNLLSLAYPADNIEFIVVSDGSTDATNSMLLENSRRDKRVRAIILQEPRGKAFGLNQAIAAAHGEVVVFTDARQRIESQALANLMENFADAAVGCASGELMLGDPESGESRQGMGLYWRIEKTIRELEAASGSVVGATGAFYAVRRSLLMVLPGETILDDVLVPMNVARQGARVVFDGRAVAWDAPNLGAQREFARKVRTLTGNYQLLQLAPWLLSGTNPLRFEFASHKLIRLFVPFALVLLLVSSLFLNGSFYRLALAAQVAVYVLSVVSICGWKLGPFSRISDAASTLVVLNLAAAVAFTKFVTGRKAVWTR
jgi:biofilm PGA synthesis N-glycosyltransferase PgaC